MHNQIVLRCTIAPLYYGPYYRQLQMQSIFDTPFGCLYESWNFEGNRAKFDLLRTMCCVEKLDSWLVGSVN